MFVSYGEQGRGEMGPGGGGGGGAGGGGGGGESPVPPTFRASTLRLHLLNSGELLDRQNRPDTHSAT